MGALEFFGYGVSLVGGDDLAHHWGGFLLLQ
jgi:hypothetical protein